MPLGFERINERQQRPNALINFIKPLDGPDKATSLEFLSRIAAQCYPVMKKHHVSVMALEEHRQNPEFLGRNFNAGEVIQLVLKDKQGRWLSMKFVQMVMMHELAHCKQMNHSRFFWKVRNDYAKQMEDLWRDGYKGEGMWGRGRGLENGAFVSAAPPDNTAIPEHLCGGSYRKRGRKRKRGQSAQNQPEKLTYAERQQRRIARKFGKHGGGESLGDDELVRGALETMHGGKRGQGKPRVANSKRGRELRASAALARFDQANRATPEQTPELEDDLGSETESDWEYLANSISGQTSVVISDRHGRDLVKVCGAGEDDEEGAGKEKDELRMLSATPKAKLKLNKRTTNPPCGQQGHMDSETESEAEDEIRRPTARSPVHKRRKLRGPILQAIELVDDTETACNFNEDISSARPRASSGRAIAETNLSAAEPELLRELDVSNAVSQPGGETSGLRHAQECPVPAPQNTPSNTKSKACPLCSMENEPGSPTCSMCSNVLYPRLMPNHWRCISEACKGSEYINAEDMGRCNCCGAPKPKLASSEAVSGHPIGITRPEVLRWE